MPLHVHLKRMVIPTLLGAFLAAAPLGSAAFAQSQTGNPMTQLQQKLDALSTEVTGLKSRLDSLELPGGGGLGVYDAKGDRIGDVVGVQDGVPWVGLTAAGRVVALQVFPDQLVGAFLWYTDADCAGDVYISGGVVSHGPNVLSVAAVKEPGGVIYGAQAGAAAQSVEVRSVALHDGTCFTYAWSFAQNVLSATQLVTLDAVFTRPYSVR